MRGGELLLRQRKENCQHCCLLAGLPSANLSTSWRPRTLWTTLARRPDTWPGQPRVSRNWLALCLGREGSSAWHWSSHAPCRRAPETCGCACASALLSCTWWWPRTVCKGLKTPPKHRSCLQNAQSKNKTIPGLDVQEVRVKKQQQHSTIQIWCRNDSSLFLL